MGVGAAVAAAGTAAAVGGISAGTAGLIASGIGAVGSLASGMMGSSAAKSAADTQAQGAQQASEAQLAASREAIQATKDQQAQTRSDLDPFRLAGQDPANSDVWDYANFEHAAQPEMNYWAEQVAKDRPGAMSQAELEATPGYQFDLSQGLKSIQSSNAAKGLGVSGAALKGAAKYATGLADNTYQNQFAIKQQQFQDTLATQQASNAKIAQRYGMLEGPVNMSQNAAVTTATTGANATAQANNLLVAGANASAAGTIGAANANASGIVGSANAMSNGINGVGSAVQNGASNYMIQQMLQDKNGGSGVVDNGTWSS
jgi:hypothetical protein